jgi:hypothetical protein
MFASYEQLKPSLSEMNHIRMIRWGEQASDEDVERAAYGMIAARDAKEQFVHLRIFARSHEIALSWFEAEEDRETLGGFGMGLKDLWKRYPDERTEVLMLRTLYEKGPCSHCREEAVRRLIERHALTEEMRAECFYDSNYDIRELVNT